MNFSPPIPQSKKPQHRRRVIILLIATLLLHWMALQSTGWTEWSDNQQPAAEKITRIELHVAPNTSPPLAVSAPPARSAAVKKPRTAKTKMAASPSVEGEAVMNAPAQAQNDLIDAAAIAMKDNTEATAPEELASTTEETVVETNPQVPAQPQYAVKPLGSIRIDMALIRIKPGENDTYGVASIIWTVKDSRYDMQIEAGVDLLFTSINLYQLSSVGRLDNFGIAPEKSAETRRTRASTATHFNHDEKTISFSASDKIIPMADGAQDRATFVMQLAAIGYADDKQIFPGQQIDMQVAEDKDAASFHFEVLAKEQIETKLGSISAWHLMRAPRPGSYNSRLDIWLAPAFGWYPVRIRNTEKNGTVTEQTATKLTQQDP